jgi:sugar lactone lactonase YvrE
MKLSSVVSALLVTTSMVFVGCGSDSQNDKKDDNKTSVVMQTPKVGDVKPMSNLNFPLGTATFSNGFELNATWGLGSAAAHKAGDANNTFYAMTDRGVNIKCKDDEEIIGMDICESGKIFPFPAFTPTIVKFEIDGENVTVKEVITLKDKDANLMTGISNPLSNFSEKAYNIDGSELAYDTNGLDAEALAVMNDGSFWIAEEYAPSLVHVDATGKVIERLIPNGVTGLESANYDVKDVLPEIIAKRHENRGIESIAISPDEKSLYFSLQSPLDNPDYKTTPNIRLYKLNLNDYSDIKEYLYVEDKPETFNKDNETKERVQKDVKISEMTALDNDILMVLERISTTTKLFKVDLSTAVEVPALSHDNLESNARGVTPVSKVKIFDTDLENGYPNKVEGIADLGGGKFLLINDNDFGIEGDNTVAKVADIDVNGRLDSKQTMGKVVFFDTNGTYQESVKVGILPDMVTFTHDGKKVLVANEGELAGNEDLDAPLYDPYGSVSIIDTATYDVDTVDFKSVTTAPKGSKIRKGAEIARDFEPEYIAVSEDDKLAWVSLQESNAVARIDLETNTLDKVFGLGFKDLSLAENAIDSKKDKVVDISALPAGVYGMYQPDTIATYKVAGVNYIVTANEGDDRDDFYGETVKASKLTHTAIGDIGDLRVNPDIGDEDGDGDYEKLYAYGTRSFSIWNGDTGALVYDSKNEMATTVANQIDHAYFNTRSKGGKWKGTDERSEKKGVEPEALALHTKNGKTFAYVGLEKQGGFFVYDITDPANAQMVEYSNDINYSVEDFDVLPNLATIDDMAPEGSVTFTQGAKDYYVVANEVSGTVSIYELASDGKVSKQGTYRTGIYNESATEIVEYDAIGKKLFVTSAAKNAVLVLGISDVTNPTLVKEIDLSAYGTGVNSVSVFNNKIAVAVEVKE